MSSEKPRGSATAVMMTCIAVVLTWLYAYNIVVHDMGWIEGFFKILDGVNELVIGVITLAVIGFGIVAVFTVTNLFTQSMTNLYSMRIIEDLLREHLARGEVKTFFVKLININDIPQPDSPLPRYVSSAVAVMAYHYLLAWFYLVVFSECLWFAAWSAGVYLDLYPETMSIVPMFAVAIPFTARLMAWFRYPYADDYAGFIPGILFVVVLLLAFVAYMGGPFQYFVEDIYNREVEGFFVKGSLFWKFLREGCIIAFYPVFGELVFLYLHYQKESDAEAKRDAEEAAATLEPVVPEDGLFDLEETQDIGSAD